MTLGGLGEGIAANHEALDMARVGQARGEGDRLQPPAATDGNRFGHGGMALHIDGAPTRAVASAVNRVIGPPVVPAYATALPSVPPMVEAWASAVPPRSPLMLS